MPTFTYPGIQVSTAGLATSTKQDTIIAELQDIDANTADVSTETTLSALNAKVTAVDTGSVAVASSALPSGAATEASLAIVAGDTTSLDAKLPAQGAALTAASVPVNIASDQTVPVSAASLPLPTGAATESTLSTLNGKVTACNTGAVVISSSALPSGAATAANQASILAELQRIETKTPVDFLDTGLLDASSTNIATAGTTVVASLAANCSELEIVEDIGEFMALTDGSDVILAYLPLGGGRVKVSISSSTALKLKSLTGSAITTGEIAINFLD